MPRLRNNAGLVPRSASGLSSTSKTLKAVDSAQVAGAFTLFRCTDVASVPDPMPAVGSPGVLGLSMFKGLRQADQHSAYQRGIILREGVHDLQSSLARRTHGSLHFPCVGTECFLHLRACFGSPLRDIVENGFPLPFGAVARVSGGLLDAVEELFFQRIA